MPDNYELVILSDGTQILREQQTKAQAKIQSLRVKSRNDKLRKSLMLLSNQVDKHALRNTKKEAYFRNNYEKKKFDKIIGSDHLYTHQIKSIKLEGGFMVSYNRLNIEDIDNSIPRFTNENFKKMDDHYHHKTEQIHIVGEYAKRRIQNYESAQ